MEYSEKYIQMIFLDIIINSCSFHMLKKCKKQAFGLRFALEGGGGGVGSAIKLIGFFAIET